jgi:hypothetical protein
MTDNVLQTLQQLVQDVIAPDVRELKVRVASLEKTMDNRFASLEKDVDVRFSALLREMDTRFDAVDQRFSTLEQKMGLQFQGVLAAIAESRAQAELTNVKLLASLSERVAVLEVKSR